MTEPIHKHRETGGMSSPGCKYCSLEKDKFHDTISSSHVVLEKVPTLSKYTITTNKQSL